MLSFTPTEEQTMLADTVRRYAVNDLQKHAHENDEIQNIPHELILKGWEIGLLPVSLPEAYGGFGEYSPLTNVIALEELGYGDLAAAIKLLTPGLFAIPLMKFGTDEQKARFLPLFCEEKPYPATAAFIEPSVLFDPYTMQTTATPDGDGYLLNGEKTYVPLAEGAEWMLVYAREGEDIAAYMVEMADADGLTLQGREKLMGIRALETYRLTLNNVRVPAEHRVAIKLQRIINHSHIALGALGTGVMRAALDYAIDYAKGRVQFGKPIATKQAIAFMLAENRIELDAARLMTWDAAWQMEAGKPNDEITQACYLAKQYVDKAALFVTDSAVQTLGGHGFIREYPVERYLRNARGLPTFTGLVLA